MPQPYTGNRPPQGSRPQLEATQLPTPQKVNYFSRAGVMDDALVDVKAQEWAERIRDLKSTQMRRFFGEVKAIERQVDLAVGQGAEREAAFGAQRARFAMLKAKVLYAKGRLKRDMPDGFVQFVVDHTHSVHSHDEFKAFVKHFEAVVGFHKFFAKD
ncbi:MAG: type III-A CRISPR-associated protein Csm2 [Thermodesulfobacteriota bacterium]